MLKEIGVYMSNLTSTQVAKIAANERWHPTIPRATHTGILKIGNYIFECDVLDNQTRIIRRKAFLKAMGKHGNPDSKDAKREKHTNLPVFLIANNLRPYLEGNLNERVSPILYKGKEGNRLIGYDATILPDVCKIYDQALRDGVLQTSQLKTAESCKILIYALAKTGITALIDECTSYQYIRERTALQELMNKWIIQEGRAWINTFPQEFFEQAYRIHGWEYPNVDRKNHPQYLGKFINKYVYEKMPKGLLEELEILNPQDKNGYRKNKHHQHLSEEVGNPGLMKQLGITISMMKVSDDKEQFKKFMDKL
jgi:hypothetical protein